MKFREHDFLKGDAFILEMIVFSWASILVAGKSMEGGAAERLTKFTELLIGQGILELEKVVDNCEEEDADPSTTLSDLHRPKGERLGNVTRINGFDLDWFSPCFIADCPYAGCMCDPILVDRKAVVR